MGRIDELLAKQPKDIIEKAQKLAALEDLKRQVNDLVDHYKAELLDEFKQSDLWTLKAGNYTVSRVPRVTPHVDNFVLLKDALIQANIPFETKEVFSDLMRPVFKQLAEADQQMPGLSISKIEYIALRPTGKNYEKETVK